MPPEGEVKFLPWPEFLNWFKGKWKPGEHVSVISPSGSGKSTFVVPLLGLRRYVLALDPKGGDETIASLGYKRLSTWPGEKKMTKLVGENDSNQRPSRYLVGPIASRTEDLGKLKLACGSALRDAFNMGGWTVYVDELQVLSDRRMMNLSGPAARLLVSARSKGISFVSSFQAPSWVPTEAVRQPTWIVAGNTRDTDTVNRMAEVMGRQKPEMRGYIRALPDFHWGIVGRSKREPFVVTKPPYVAPRRPKA